MKRVFDLTVVGFSLAAAACGPGLDPEVIVHAPRPTSSPATSANGGGGGCPPIGHAEPLIVDWLTTRRSDLGLVMKEGVAVVSYDCSTLQLLTQCKLPGSYSYASVAREEDVIQLANPAEMQANVPFGATALSTAIEGGGAIDVALVASGRLSTTLAAAVMDDASGSCTGATHFVRSARLGAFATAHGSRGVTRTVDQIFAAAAAAGASGQGGATSKEGELEACRSAKPGAQAPVERCHGPVRLELVPLLARRPSSSELDATAQAEEEEQLKLPNPCPHGTVLSGDKCSPQALVPAHLCDPNDSRACRAECDKGDAGSCYHLAYHYLSGKDLPRDDARAASLFEKACDAGIPQACYASAKQHMSDILSNKAPADAAGRAKLRELSDKACQMGNGWACSSVAEWYLREDTQAVFPKDPSRALALLRRGCDLGYGPSCSSLGAMLVEGKVVAKDAAVAVGVLHRACEGGRPEDCLLLGDSLRKGQGVQKDGEKVIAAYERGCDLGEMRACNAAGSVYVQGDGVPRDVVKAYALFKKGCPEKGFGAEACMSLAAMYEQGTGIPRDTARAAALFEKVCGTGGCLRAAEIWQRGDGVPADPARAFSLYEKACVQWSEQRACGAYGPLLEAKDKERARTFYADQCARTKDKAACASHKRLGGGATR